jgi:renalase
LTAAGREVVLFDKGDAPGGRLATRHWRDLRFDHGAQFFTARDRAFQRQVVEWARAGVVAPWRGRLVRFAADGSIGMAYDSLRYVGVPGQRSIAEHMADGLVLHQRAEVRQVDRVEGGWRLTEADGSQHGGFAALVVAVPAPQAVALLSLAPTVQAIASEVTMAPCWAVLAAFDRRIVADFDGAFIESGRLSWIARDASKPQRPDVETWVLHASSQWSRRNLDDKPGRVTMALLDSFAKLVPGAADASPVTQAHRWMYALPERQHPDRCLFDAELRIGACGDWCDGPRVEGAWLSGMALARRLGVGVV